ncbi:unnamed protein product [Cylicocyclus nassatus]|uniref:Uncharacterized protein n=1 Tax=Cylicocyclus nassatus TaxID=53992 RepID=A0AA36H2A4_CYLNA|nr:unnamed protein product [Cylicocyclus nassatus]
MQKHFCTKFEDISSASRSFENIVQDLALFVKDYATIDCELMTEKKQQEVKNEEEDFQPPKTTTSEYLISQIRLDKPTANEVKEVIQKETDDDEPFRDVTPCPSEYQMTQLNYFLSGVPIVQAFNEAEKKKDVKKK